MAGLNLTGQPNASDYAVGRGRVYAAALDATGRPKGYRFLGNAPSVVFSMALEVLKHFQSYTGLKIVDKEITLSQELGVKLTLDELNYDNLASFFSGATASYSNATATGGVSGVANLTVYEQGRWYDLYKGTAGIPTTDSFSARIYDIGAVTIATKTEGTDFLVDRDLGRIFAIVGGALTGALPSGTAYNAVIAANGSADATVDEVKGLTQVSIPVALKIITENPADGAWQHEYQVHKIALKADGDLSVIGGDEWEELGLTGTAETNAVADADSPTLTIRTHANAQV